MADTGSALAPREEEPDVRFEPVVRLTEQVDTKTHEENEDVLFEMRGKLFRFDAGSSEWKERGTGNVRLLSHKDTKKVRLVMRREGTLKVCANHYISADMKLQPNIGSERSWVWKVAADYSEPTPTSETLAIRFTTPENAGLFKAQFEMAQANNIKLSGGTVEEKSEKEKEADEKGETKEDAEEKKEETKSD